MPSIVLYPALLVAVIFAVWVFEPKKSQVGEPRCLWCGHGKNYHTDLAGKPRGCDFEFDGDANDFVLCGCTDFVPEEAENDESKRMAKIQH